MQQENTIIQYLQHLSELTKGARGGEVYQQALQKAQTVKVISTADAVGKLNAKKVEWLDIQLKACYRNALLTAIALECDYVEGYMAYENMPFPFEHAWCYKDGKYFDPTADFALKTKESRTYVQLVKVKYTEALAISRKVGYTGNIFNTLVQQEVKRKTI